MQFQQCLTVVRELHKAGVTILAGTDVGTSYQIPGISLHDELALLVQAGLSPMAALQAATRNPARVFNLTDQGTVEPGMRADLVLLDAPCWSLQTGLMSLALLCEAVYLVSSEAEAQDAETACLLQSMVAQGVPVRGHLVTMRSAPH